MPWNWDCKLWANWNASSHPAECCDFPSARIRLVEMEGPGEAARIRFVNAVEAETFHFTPTSASWLNAVEGVFAKLTRRRLKRGVFRSVVDLRALISRFVEENKADPKPFARITSPERVIAAVRRGKQPLAAPARLECRRNAVTCPH